jgi:hypothetical protein
VEEMELVFDLLFWFIVPRSKRYGGVEESLICVTLPRAFMARLEQGGCGVS